MSRSVFYITAPGMGEAEKIARHLVKERVAACVNVIPGIKSFFSWEGEVQAEEEVLVIGKTRSSLINKLVEAVKELHPYELPCTISWKIKDGNPAFLEWIDHETEQDS